MSAFHTYTIFAIPTCRIITTIDETHMHVSWCCGSQSGLVESWRPNFRRSPPGTSFGFADLDSNWTKLDVPMKVKACPLTAGVRPLPTTSRLTIPIPSSLCQAHRVPALFPSLSRPPMRFHRRSSPGAGPCMQYRRPNACTVVLAWLS